MSEKGLFEEAIEELREHADFCHHQWADPSKTTIHAKHYHTKESEYIRAICVLEVVGKMDKAEFEWFTNEVSHLVVDTGKYMKHGFEYRRAIKIIGNIRALLDSLPDEPARNAETDSATFMGMDKATELVKEKIESLPEKEE